MSIKVQNSRSNGFFYLIRCINNCACDLPSAELLVDRNSSDIDSNILAWLTEGNTIPF